MLHGLDQHRGKPARTFQPSTFAKVQQRHPGIGIDLHFMGGAGQFLGDHGMRVADLDANAFDTGFQAQTGLPANHHHIERIGHAVFQGTQVPGTQMLHHLVWGQQPKASGNRHIGARMRHVDVRQPNRSQHQQWQPDDQQQLGSDKQPKTMLAAEPRHVQSLTQLLQGAGGQCAAPRNGLSDCNDDPHHGRQPRVGVALGRSAAATHHAQPRRELLGTPHVPPE